MAADNDKLTKDLNEKDYQISKLLQMGIGQSQINADGSRIKKNSNTAVTVDGKRDTEELGKQLATMKDMLNDARREAQNLREENYKLQVGGPGGNNVVKKSGALGEQRYSATARADAAGLTGNGNNNDQDFSTTEACKQLKRCMELSLANQNLLDQLFVARTDTVKTLSEVKHDE